MADLNGRKLGKYQLAERLGRGGMADVYKAFQPGLDRFVAVKTIHETFADSPEFVSRFKREAQSVAMLRHPHILQVIDFDVEDGLYFMVMEYIRGGTLKEYVEEKGALPAGEALRITEQLADALDYAHEKGMIHRDIKPANIMFTDKGYASVVLTDYGIAHIADASSMTASGMMIGSPAYMSPEAGRGERVDERADIYGLGVVLYEMLSGRVPFDADTPYAIIMKHNNEPLPPINSLELELPLTVEQIVLRALMKDPADRFASAADMKAAVSQALHSLTHEQSTAVNVVPPIELVDSAAPTGKLPPTELNSPSVGRRVQVQADDSVTPPQWRNWLLAAGLGLGGLLLIVLLAWAAGRQRDGSAVPVLPTVAQLPESTAVAQAMESTVVAQLPEATAEPTRSASAYFASGQDYLEDEAFNRAIGDLSRAIDLEPDQADYYEARGWAYLGIDQTEPAIDDFSTVIDLVPEQVGAYWGRADAYMRQDRGIDAAVDFLRITELEPDNPEPYGALGWLALEQKEYEIALENATQAIERDPLNSEYYHIRARANAFLRRFQEAEADLNEAIALSPYSHELLADRGRLYLELDRPGEAIENLRQAINLAPDIAEYHALLGRAYVMTGQRLRALASFRTYLDLAGDEADPAIRAQLEQLRSRDDSEAQTPPPRGDGPPPPPGSAPPPRSR